MFNGECSFKDWAIGGAPVALSCVGISPRFVVFYAQFHKIIMLRADFLPLFPEAHAYPSSEPLIQRLGCFLHVSHPKIVHPAYDALPEL